MPHTLRNIYRLCILLACWTIPFLAQAALQITEILPDPVGDDNAEWIEILNTGDTSISTAGWKIIVKTRTTSLPTKTASAGQYIIFTKAEAKFTLTNTGADVSLVDPSGNVTNKIIYNKAPSGQSFSFINNAWQWTKSPTPAASNVLTNPITSTTTTQPSNSSKVVESAAVQNLKSGAKIIVEGVVVAAPEELGTKIIFINGLQLNLTGDMLSELARGDLVRINGSVSHTKTYGTRLNVNSADNIIILSNEPMPEPEILKIKDLNTKHEGLLIKLSGKVVGKGSNWLDLEDEGSQLRVTLRNRDLDWPKLTNEQVEITGLVTLSQNELRLWPRSLEDINIPKGPETNNSPEIINLTEKNKTDWRGYMVLIFLGLILLTGWLWESGKLIKLYEKAKKYLRQLLKR